MKRFGTLLAALLVYVLIGGSQAGEKTARPLDKDFLIKVASAHNAEIEISKLADKHAGSADVKDFANMLVKEHKSAYDQMGELLKNRKIGVVAGLEKETRDELKRLGKLEGAEFDREYLNCMIREHKTAIGIFENQAKNGQEADIRGYAQEMLPDLRKHLKKAEELAKKSGK
jgi:putative membrane protein